MKTLVLFRMPDGSYWSRWLENLPAFPLEGMKYLMEGIASGVYTASEVIQPLSVNENTDQLSALLALDLGGDSSMVALAQIRDLDAPSIDELDEADEFSLLEDVPDHVILVRLTGSQSSSIITQADSESA